MEARRNPTLDEWRDATRGALSDFLVDELVERLLYEIETRAVRAVITPRPGAKLEHPTHPNCQCTTVAHHSGPVYRPAAEDPNRVYPDESPAHRQTQTAPNAFVPIGEVRRMLRDRRGYIRENTEAGRCRLYDPTGTYIGNVSQSTVAALAEQGETTARHEDDIYDTHWAKEENRDGTGAT